MAAKQTSRRDFLRILGAGTCGALIHSAFMPHQSMLAYGSPMNAAALGPLPVMIVVNMAGGCSLNISPLYAGAYRDKNPTISYGPENSLPLNSSQGLHPSLTAFNAAFGEGKLAVINMVGYPNPNRSHDESTEIWFRGARDGAALGGWGARMTAQLGSTFGGISLAGSNMLIQGDINPPRALGDLDNFGEYDFWGTNNSTWLREARTNMRIESNMSGNESQNFVRANMDKLDSSLETVKAATQANPPGTFPNTNFGGMCKDAAKLVGATSLGVQFIFLELGGFDTHSGERQALTNRLTELNGGINALIASLKTMGRYNSTTIVTMSEFGRTCGENGSQGTDHGHCNAMFVMGGAVNGGIKTPAPTVAEISYDYLKDYHVHFAQPFREIVAAMGLNPNAIFPPGSSSNALGLF
ncbi:MAG: DUF1501 domain-containing protein [Deltaproteobacteria bacterium]|nr:DUF1501 domain-containing protein [Deltaproteobacteria bacterium]